MFRAPGTNMIAVLGDPLSEHRCPWQGVFRHEGRRHISKALRRNVEAVYLLLAPRRRDPKCGQRLYNRVGRRRVSPLDEHLVSCILSFFTNRFVRVL